MKQRKIGLTALMTLAVIVGINLCLAGSASARTDSFPELSVERLMIHPDETAELTVTIPGGDQTDTFIWTCSDGTGTLPSVVQIFTDAACTEPIDWQNDECYPGTYYIKGLSEGEVTVGVQRLHTDGHSWLSDTCTVRVLDFTPIPDDQSAAENGMKYFVGYEATTGTYISGGNEIYPNVCNAADSKWCINFPSNENPIFAEFNRTDAFIPKKVYLRTADDNTKEHGRNPKSWKLLAKQNQNDAEWTELANVTDDMTMEDKDYRAYAFDLDNPSNAKYQYFRFEVSQVQNGNTFQLSELYMAGYNSSSDIPKAPQTITASDITAYVNETGLKVNAATSGDGALSYRVTAGDAVSVDPVTGEINILKEGTATITITAVETDHYTAAEKEITVTILPIPTKGDRSAKTGIHSNNNLFIALALAGLACLIGFVGFALRKNKSQP